MAKTSTHPTRQETPTRRSDRASSKANAKRRSTDVNRTEIPHQACVDSTAIAYGNLVRLLVSANAAFYATLVLGGTPSTTLALTQVTGDPGEFLSRTLFSVMAIASLILIAQCFSPRWRSHPLSFLPMFILGLEFLLLAGVANDLNASTPYVINAVLQGTLSICGALVQILDRR